MHHPRAAILLSIVPLFFFAASVEAAEQLTADTPRTTPGGASFVAPGGWSIETRGNAVILTAEGDSRIAFVDVEDQDPDAAVKAAWAILRPEMKWKVKLTTDAPGREGWDSFRSYDYETSPADHRAVGAQAAKRGKALTIVLFDMDEGVAGKRGGQIAAVFDHLQPPGYKRETFAGKKAAALDAAHLAKIKEFVEKGRAAFGIPGVALGLYQGGQVVFEGGFGVRELGKPAPVDADTLFMIASNTKSMTTLLLATLVDEGKLRWDTPVTQVMPDFKLGDPETTKQVLIQHLVCACTGLPRQDFEWLLEFKNATPKSQLAFLGKLQPTSKFGEMFQYSNLLASAGGYVAAHVIAPDQELGAAYDAAMATRVFGPIGMTSTTFDMERALAANHASPHSWDVDGKTAAAVMAVNYSVVPVRPAGGAWSNARDMLKYLRMELGKGVLPGGTRVASEASVVKRREAQIKIGNDVTYGMGLEVDTEWGIPVVHHGGSLIGYKSDMIYLPEHDVAAVILTNSDEGVRLLDPFRRRLLEVLFDGKPEAEEDLGTISKTMKNSTAEERTHLTLPADAAAAAKLAARYSSPELGDLAVARDGRELGFDFGEWKSPVASRKNEDGTIAFVTTVPGFIGMAFVMGEADGTRTLTFRDAQHEYVFRELKP
ncbi:MAG TPA: serine hydrolase domain-containing protein [Candidatus Polarisedimenticolaceae bacterium]|nr:serine hydrolase domain-containing protein [Candidatus Polarisedimenticolaceae bacterium]